MIATSINEIERFLNAKENEHVEFKEAKNNYHFETLVKYCAALANEGGGRFVLGITDKLPRKIVGSSVFQNIERTKAGLIERLHLRIDAEEIHHPSGRILIFHVPTRPIGYPIQYEGAYWMRAGEDLVPMTQDMLQRIFAEVGPDFSAEICDRASLSDLDPSAINKFRLMWSKKSGNTTLLTSDDNQLLTDSELLIDGQLTYAALILFGIRSALGRILQDKPNPYLNIA